MRACARSIAVCMTASLTAWGAAAQDADEELDQQTANPPKSSLATLFGPPTSEKPAFDFLTGGMPDQMLYFSGTEVQSWGFSAYAGAQWMPKSFYKDGFIMRFTMSNSLFSYKTPDRRYDTNILRAAVMPGYRFKINNLEVQVLAGVDIAIDTLAIDQHFASLRGKTGARITADLWWEPTPSWMLQYSVSRTLIDDALTMRAAVGWRLLDRFWIGPEASISDDIYSREFRVGAHLTGFHTAEYEWTLALGHVQDNFQRSGLYGRFGLVLRPPRPTFFDN
jgi:hypothetical protein